MLTQNLLVAKLVRNVITEKELDGFRIVRHLHAILS
jgi:hypothetical protein